MPDLKTVSVIMVLALSGVAAIVAIIGGLTSARRGRELDHAERMKAMELGLGMPEDANERLAKVRAGINSDEAPLDDKATLARKCYSTALWVCFWGFLAVAQAGNAGAFNTTVAVALAASTGAVGVAAIFCGTILARRIEAPTHRKSMVDADEFDVVGSRG